MKKAVAKLQSVHFRMSWHGVAYAEMSIASRDDTIPGARKHVSNFEHQRWGDSSHCQSAKFGQNVFNFLHSFTHFCTNVVFVYDDFLYTLKPHWFECCQTNGVTF